MNRPPTFQIPDEELEKLAKQFKVPIEQEQRRMKRSVYPQLSYELKRSATRFVRLTTSKGSKPDDLKARKDYQEAGDLLKQYIKGEVLPEEFCREINKYAEPIPWTLQVNYRGEKSLPHFTLEPDSWGALDGWRHLAILLDQGLLLPRFKICALNDCAVLFYDGSPRGDKTTCSTKHKNIQSQRTSRKNSRP